MSPRQKEFECPDCGTKNPVNSKFCDSCGLEIAEAARTASATKESTAPDRSESRDIQQALGKARGLLKNVRMLFIVFGVASLFPSVLLLVASTSAPKFLVLGLVSAVFSIFLFGGACFLFLQPLFWTVSVASLSTILAILLFPHPIYVVGFGIIAFGLWGSLPLVLNIVRLKKEYPDLITSEKLKSREKRDVGTSAARVRAAERLSRDRQRAFKMYGAVGGIILLVVVAVIAIKAWPDAETVNAGTGTSAPKVSAEKIARAAKLFDPVVKKFRGHFAANERDAVEAMFEKGYGERMWGKVLSNLKRHGYDPFPAIEESDVYPRRDELERDLFLEWDSGTIKTRWRFAEDRWEIVKFVLKYSD
jgi:hypothetical protein